ncbi:MAG: hypothetical protein A2X49_02760 [Lentisphaerae bacterium GWF2_52_8]|nr:MAG: hypothetical protein A2X49_02760 [Lentisphaerae bacterium GWF2_52_8]
MLKRVIYNCPFVPPEWVAAHGLQPSRIRPEERIDAAPKAGLCSYAHSFLKTALAQKPDAIILSTRCDQMRRLTDSQTDRLAIPVFMFNVPATWQTTDARKLYSSELRRLGRFLEKLGGRSPSKKCLSEEIAKWDHNRKKLCEARRANSASHFSELLESFHRSGGKLPDKLIQKKVSPKGVSLGVIGGPLLAGRENILRVTELAGGQIVFDGTEDSERTLPDMLRAEKLQKSPFEELVHIYFDTIPDVFRRPDTALHEWLRRMITMHKPRGLVLSHFVWCDLWRAQISRMREWSGLPILSIDLSADSGEGAKQRIRTRLEAFLEELA